MFNEIFDTFFIVLKLRSFFFLCWVDQLMGKNWSIYILINHHWSFARKIKCDDGLMFAFANLSSLHVN